MRLGGHVEAHQLGGIYGPDTTFQIGENQRIPDVAFVAATRFPVEGEPEGIWPMPPDLAVEIISPYDLYEKVISKVEEYLASGVRQVWLISSEHKTITIYSSPTHTTILTEADDLVSEELLPTSLPDRRSVPVASGVRANQHWSIPFGKPLFPAPEANQEC